MEYSELLAFEHLPFDSDVFRFPFYRLDLEKIDHASKDLEFLHDTKLKQFGCDAKILTKDEKLSAKALSLGFEIICQQTTLELDASQGSFKDDALVEISSEMSDSDISLHSRNFGKDRLSLDQRISPGIVSRFYEKWIRNAFGMEAKLTYVLESGFCITLNQRDKLKIDLVSVLEKRKKIGERLLLKVLHDAQAKGQGIVQVTTESHNKGAIGLYQKCGFRPVSIHHCLHFFNIPD